MVIMLWKTRRKIQLMRNCLPKIFLRQSPKQKKHVLDMYLSSDNEHFDIFEGRCASLKNLSLKLNTPLPASTACERLFSYGGMILIPHRTSLTDRHFEACLLTKLNHKFCKWFLTYFT